MLSATGLNQYYGGSHILRDIALEVPTGACTVVLGRNGVGKSTLLKCLIGVLPVRTGQLMFDGRDVTRLPPHARAQLGMAYVPQGREIFARLTVEENLLLAETAAGAKQSGDPRPALYELFPILKQMRHRRGGDLSGGQQQQLAIARALIARPKLIMLDEPTEGIQPSIIKDIARVIAVLKEQRMTLLLVEQYLEFAQSLADHYVVLTRGEVVQRGTGSELRAAQAPHFLAV